jgi:hypothetical protein
MVTNLIIRTDYRYPNNTRYQGSKWRNMQLFAGDKQDEMKIRSK